MKQIIYWVLLVLSLIYLYFGIIEGEGDALVVGIVLLLIALVVNWSKTMKGVSRSSQVAQEKGRELSNALKGKYEEDTDR